jgi:hypothetical protein
MLAACADVWTPSPLGSITNYESEHPLPCAWMRASASDSACPHFTEESVMNTRVWGGFGRLPQAALRCWWFCRCTPKPC